MESAFDLAAANLLSPMILFFALGLAASLAKSDLSVPEAIAKGLSLYLMLGIGFKGGAVVAQQGLDVTMVLALASGALLSALLPLVAFRLLVLTTKLSRVDAAAVAAHYGSISIVPFLAATQALERSGIPFEGYMVAVAAAMETPAIMVALWLSRTSRSGTQAGLMREVVLNGSIVVLVGAFIIGGITGAEGLETIAPLIVDPFAGVLCIFLLDMGIVAGRGLREGRGQLTPGVVIFGLYMPLVGGAFGALAAMASGLSVGGTAQMITLAASASYIAVPAALRLALPEARPSIYLPLSLGVTFPFNLIVGIPLYLTFASALH